MFRSFIVVTSNLEMVTGRQKPKLLSISCSILNEGLQLKAPDMEELIIPWKSKEPNIQAKTWYTLAECCICSFVPLVQFNFIFHWDHKISSINNKILKKYLVNELIIFNHKSRSFQQCDFNFNSFKVKTSTSQPSERN